MDNTNEIILTTENHKAAEDEKVLVEFIPTIENEEIPSKEEFDKARNEIAELKAVNEMLRHENESLRHENEKVRGTVNTLFRKLNKIEDIIRGDE